MRDSHESWFYVDEDLDSPDFVEPLIEAGFTIKRHRDYFAPGTVDEVWMPQVAEWGWYAFSHDFNIVIKAAQTRIVLDSGLGLFIVRGTTAHSVLGASVARTKARIDRRTKKNYLPFIFSITGASEEGKLCNVNPLRPPDRDWNKGKFERKRQMKSGVGIPIEPNSRTLA